MTPPIRTAGFWVPTYNSQFRTRSCRILSIQAIVFGVCLNLFALVGKVLVNEGFGHGEPFRCYRVV
jgi:hypothetical protein